MIPYFLDEKTDPAAPRENGWYILDGCNILEEGPFTSEPEASSWIDNHMPNTNAGGPSLF